MKKLNFSLLFIFIFTFSFWSCSHLKNKIETPEIKFQNLVLKQVSFDSLNLDVALEVTNPNALAIEVHKLKYEVVIKNKIVHSQTLDRKIKIPAKKTENISVPLNLKYKDLAYSFLELINQKGLPYQVRGSVNVGPFNLPFDQKGTLDFKNLQLED